MTNFDWLDTLAWGIRYLFAMIIFAAFVAWLMTTPWALNLALVLAIIFNALMWWYERPRRGHRG
jgi:Flp pilus assembly protein TadB